MRYIVDIPKWVDVQIKRILADPEKGYSGTEEFIVVACENQIKIENVEGGAGLMSAELEVSRTKTESLDQIQNLITSEIETCSTVVLPDSEKIETVLLWGQVYRIFPVKFGARVLANMLKKNNNTYVNLEDFRTTAADAARKYGLSLKRLDEKHNRKPGEKFSTGLPIGKNPELSKNRYKAHYLAYQTGRETLAGALADLRLINLEGDKIGITEEGLTFAHLPNPILDNKDSTPDAVLSEEESGYYLSITSKFLPKEAEFMKSILSMIEGGEPQREEFNAKVKEFLEGILKRDITPAVANTMRSGALSRMWELGLVENARIGRTVAYSITEKGKKFLHGTRSD